MPTYGQLIKFAREDAGLTQAELANAIRVKRETLSRWERDHLINTPPADEMDRLITLLPSLKEVTLLRSLGYHLDGLVDDQGNILTQAAQTFRDSLTPEEHMLLRFYRQLTGKGKQTLLALAQTLEDLFSTKNPGR